MSQDPGKPHENVKQEETSRFPCPACGGGMSFDPSSQTLTCEYCGNRIEIEREEKDILEYDFDSAEDKGHHSWGAQKRVIHCESCGAETVLDEVTTAQFCAFCGSSHIVDTRSDAGIAPESLVPFKVTSRQAMEYFKVWISKRFFAPRALKKEYHSQRLKGVYVPFWTYDSDTYSTYTGEGGTYYWVTETHWVTENGKRRKVTRRVRKIRWWPTSGTYKEYFDDVLVNASGRIDDNMMGRLEPFNLKELTPYKPEYLSGFLAERYSVTLKAGWEKAKDFIKSEIRSGVIRKINADEVRNLIINTKYSNIKYKHLLLPVWISAYTYKGKIYNFMVNGQTGEVQGKSPVSPWKVAGVVLLASVVAGIAFYLYYLYG